LIFNTISDLKAKENKYYIDSKQD